MVIMIGSFVGEMVGENGLFPHSEYLAQLLHHVHRKSERHGILSKLSQSLISRKLPFGKQHIVVSGMVVVEVTGDRVGGMVGVSDGLMDGLVVGLTVGCCVGE